MHSVRGSNPAPAVSGAMFAGFSLTRQAPGTFMLQIFREEARSEGDGTAFNLAEAASGLRAG